MVWTLDDLGAFLDFARTGTWIAPVFELAAATGMRRGELCGLPWTDVDMDKGVVHVTTARVQAGWAVFEGGPKSEAGHRRDRTRRAGHRHAESVAPHQSARRLEIGAAWHDSGLVFTQDDGRPWHPDSVTDRFERLSFARTWPRYGCTMCGMPTSRTCSPPGWTPGSSPTGWATSTAR